MSSTMRDVQNLLAPFTYVCSQPGKNVRKQFAEACNYWFKLEENVAKSLSVIGAKLHNASLVIDDVEDNSDLRRGKPAAHLVYGVPLSINAANYVYFEALCDVLALNNPGAIKIFAEAMLSLHHGQGMDLFWRDQHEFKDFEERILPPSDLDWISLVPSEQDYENVIVKKTSGQFLFTGRLMNHFSAEDKNVEKLAELVGLCFQIRDDLMNLVSSEYTVTKGFCEDISEGKLSFPVIRALNKKSFSKEKRFRLWTILKMKTMDPDIKEEALVILEQSGAIQYTEQRLAKLKFDIAEEIQKLGGNPELENVLRNFWG